MRIIHGLPKSLFVLSLLVSALSAQATSLTFDVYTDSSKTTFANANPISQSYGDNVTNFSPTGAFGSYYFNYGSAGGFTPHVTVEYRFLSIALPQDPSPGQNGPPNGYLWNYDYGDLTNVLYGIYGGTANGTNVPGWYMEIRLTADPAYRVTLSNFDISSWPHVDRGGQDLKIIRDANSATAATLWSAGPDGTVVVHGSTPAHDSYTPMVTVADGHTLSLIYGNGAAGPDIGVDNLIFFESVPEPSLLAMTGAGLGLLLTLVRRRNAITTTG